ncbi:hypothetical protein [Sediminicurvatus halobius]|uniref:Uncharacterized protein n=1 Tax=Sediminicurvatus halobius TaxID=2182432 RepID=A0A2U2N1L4_9GAMM|nr:hypothetical protein [Spiribacter halobius]PWG63115.1 hypothetical protein DEM34_09700 [Spiribacter halobius]UEX77564.1 hypothetical protein LMH63_16755 [Spiribacter halobius]
MRNDRRTATILLVALAIYTAAMVTLGVFLDAGVRSRIFAESGPFETASEWFWFALAVACLWLLRATPRGGIALGLAALLAGLREAEMHKALTADSIFKTNYYLDSAAPLWEKALGGAVALGAIGLVVYLGVRAWRLLLREGNWRTPWGLVVAVGALALPVLKVIDRAPALLVQHFGLALPAAIKDVMGSVEEGVEMALPLLFLAALRMATANQPAPATRHAVTGDR